MEPMNVYATIGTSAGTVTVKPTSIAHTETGWHLVATSVHTGEQVVIDLSLLTFWKAATDEEIEAADADRARLAEEREAALEEDLTDGEES